jgi:hypothetical protein
MLSADHRRHAYPWLRCNARGRDGDIRKKLAVGVWAADSAPARAQGRARARKEYMDALKFDQQAIDALQTLGFEIADDKEMARIGGDDIDIYVFRRDDTESEFLLTIELPNGINLKCLTHRLALLEAEREVAARSRDNDQCRFTANVGSSGRANPGAIAMRRR